MVEMALGRLRSGSLKHAGRRRPFQRAGVGAAFAAMTLMASTANAEAPSRWGKDDRVGAVNEITPATVKDAGRLIRTGKVYSLAIDTKPDPTLFRVYRVTLRSSEARGTNQLTSVEDMVITSPSIGTSLDGLSHVGRGGVHYNGIRIGEVTGSDGGLRGAKVFGTETIPPIVARGILLDFVRYGDRAALTGRAGITRAHIEAVAKAQGVDIRRGDVVLLHTGWLQNEAGKPAPSGVPSVPGLGTDGARYLASLGVVAVGADTGGLEVNPAEVHSEFLPVHQILLVDNGVYIIENVKTEELAADSAYEFMFVLATPKLPGTVQSTITPVAIR